MYVDEKYVPLSLYIDIKGKIIKIYDMVPFSKIQFVQLRQLNMLLK